MKIEQSIMEHAMENIKLQEQKKKMTAAAKQRPAVTIMISFEPVFSSKSEMAHRLKIITEKVKRELQATYPEDKAAAVVLKLQNLIKNINYNTDKHALALFVSPQTEKIFYLDAVVEDRLVIDESFSIRDLVFSMKKHIRYLVMLLSASSSKMYLGNSFKVVPIKFNVPDSIFAYKNDIPEPVANFSDPNKRKEVLLDKFLHHIDQGLAIALKHYPGPVFVAGTERTLGHFRSITQNEKHIAEFIPGNYIESGEARIAELVQPYVMNWMEVKQKSLLQELEKADNDHKLIYGMKDVWMAANAANGRLLVVEKNYRRAFNSTTQPSAFVRDMVDKVMEKILQCGGDIEFVDDGILKPYKRIVLVPFY